MAIVKCVEKSKAEASIQTSFLYLIQAQLYDEDTKAIPKTFCITARDAKEAKEKILEYWSGYAAEGQILMISQVDDCFIELNEGSYIGATSAKVEFIDPNYANSFG